MISILKKNFFLIFFLAAAFVASSSLAFRNNIAFFLNASPSLYFATTTQSVLGGACSAAVTVQTKNAAGIVANVPSDLTVNLNSTASVEYYSDATCVTQIANAVVLSGTSQVTFYYLLLAVPGGGTDTLTASATGYKDATQVHTAAPNPYVWVGAGGNANWSTGLNWSGGSAPGGGNTALFNSTCVTNCSPTISANTTVGGVRIESGFIGTITQASTRTFTVNNNYVMKGGVFVGGDSTVTVSGDFVQTAGSFTAPNLANLVLNKNFVTSGTFVHNSGTVYGATWCCGFVTFQSSSTLNHFYLGGSNGLYSINGTINVSGNLIVNDTYTPGSGCMTGNAGVISVSGNITLTNMGGTCYGGQKTLIKTVGVNQTVTGTYPATISSLEFASSGMISLNGDIGVDRDFTYTTGTIFPGTSTFRTTGYASRTFTANNINLNNFHYNSYNSVLTLVGTMNLAGNLVLEETYTGPNYCGFLGGTINLSGDLNNIYFPNYNFTTAIKLVGSSQTITSVSGQYLGGIEIASSGTVNLAGTITSMGNFTYTSGTINSGTSDLIFSSTAAITPTLTIVPGNEVYNNVKFSNQGSGGGVYAITGTMKIGGNLELFRNGSSTYNSINTGTLEVGKNLSITNWALAGSGGTAAITLNGTGTQTITQTSGLFPRGTLTIAKPSGDVSLATNTQFNYAGQATNVTSGIINMNGYSLGLSSLSLNGNTVNRGGGVLTVTAGSSPYGGVVNP